MPYVSKPSCTRGIIVSLQLICCIQCGFSISYLSIPGIAAHDKCNIPPIFTFFVQFQCPMSRCFFRLYNCLFCLQSFCKCIFLLFFFGGVFYVCVLQAKDQQSHSMYLILAYFIFVTTIFRLFVFKFYDFVILLQNH